MEMRVLTAGNSTWLSRLRVNCLSRQHRLRASTSLSSWRGAGIEEVHLNVRQLTKRILESYWSKTSVNGKAISFARENRLMVTAGGAKRLADCFEETFVFFGYALTDANGQKVVAFYKGLKTRAMLSLAPVADALQYGVFGLNSAFDLAGFQENRNPVR